MQRSNAARAGAFIFLGSLVLLLGTVACTWQQLQPGTDNTRRLYVIGNLQQTSAEQVAKAAQTHLGKGFFEVDVQAIQDVVAELPWVASVSVHRRWPDAVVVRVSEHTAAARWGKSALLSNDNVVFAPEISSWPQGLPQLDGPPKSGAEVLATLPDLQAVLNGSNRNISELRLDARGSWQAQMADGLVVRLGRGDPIPRMQRFANQLLNHKGPALKRRLEGAEYVDLRYTDGFAVGPPRSEELDQSVNDSRKG